MEGLNKFNDTVNALNGLMADLNKASDQNSLNKSYQDVRIAINAISVHLSAVAREAFSISNQRRAEIQELAMEAVERTIKSAEEAPAKPAEEAPAKPADKQSTKKSKKSKKNEQK